MGRDVGVMNDTVVMIRDVVLALAWCYDWRLASGLTR